MALTACPEQPAPGDGPPDDEPATDPELRVLAGSTGSIGNLDGPRDRALYALPSGVAVDGDGTVFVADATNGALRKVDVDGNVTTLAPRFLLPTAVVIGDDGALYVSDNVAKTVSRVVDDEAVVVVDEDDGLVGPEGLASDGAGGLFIADRDGGAVRHLGEDGSVSVVADADDGLVGPFGIAVGEGVDGQFVAVADADNNVVVLLQNGAVTPLAGTPGSDQGTVDGAGDVATFGRPRALLFIDEGLLVADTFNDRLRLIGPDRSVTTFAGSTFGYDDGTRETATFSFPSGFAKDGDGRIYVADAGTDLIRRIDGDDVTTFSGRPAELEYEDGPANDARFFGVTAALAVPGGLLLVDQVNNAIRRLDDDGTVSTFVTEPLLNPRDIVSDGGDGFYVSDQGNHLIRHVDKDGAVTTFAGGPIGRGAALVDGPALEALFFAPAGLFLDDDGALYVADAGNHAVRVIEDGVVRTLAGDGLPGRKDGPGALARFNLPQAVVVDADTVYVADGINCLVRAIEKDRGIVTTLAGTLAENVEEPARGDADGDGLAAAFNGPADIVTDGDDLLVADANNHLIRRVTKAGVVSTVVGTRGVVGVVEGALPASLFEPQGLGRDADGDLVITFQSGVLVVE